MNITITDVHKRYGDVVALDGLSVTIPSGSTVGVLGTNGAGKTTLFELLVGHDTPNAGRIEVGGLDVERAGDRVRERIGFLPEHTGFPNALTGREVLSVHARIHGIDGRAERIEECLDLVGLTDAADRRVEGYSNGMGGRLGLAAALLARPPVLVLDEPTAGLDPRGVADFHEIIQRIGQESDATVVLSSHVLDEVERLCDEVVILDDGRLQAAGDVDDLRASTDATPTVILHPTAGTHDDLLEAVQGRGEVTDTGETIDVSCETDAAFSLCRDLDSALVERFEVREPGLEATFLEATNGDAHSSTDTKSQTTETAGGTMGWLLERVRP